jgi:hypothetical protein
MEVEKVLFTRFQTNFCCGFCWIMTGACGIVVVIKKEVDTMKRELLDNGNIWQKSDGRWIGMVRYRDEYGATQRKSFSSKKKINWKTS